MKKPYLLPIAMMFTSVLLTSCWHTPTVTPGTYTGSTNSGTTNTGVTNTGGTNTGSTSTGTTDQTILDIYFQTRKDNALEDCGKISTVTRTVPTTFAPAAAALEQLFVGPTPQEKAEGLVDYMITRETSNNLKRVFIKDGVAYLDWKDLRQVIPNASSSCGSAAFLKPIEATLKQFPTVTKVIHAIEGKPATFYEWIQMGCSPENNNCDASPYQPYPISCAESDKGLPIITSISTSSGSIGTKLTITGCGFSGFEGDKTAWIENTQGVKGILYSESGSTSELLHITLKSPLCQTDTSYSGLPCEKSLPLTPGKYQLYVMPWGKVSNRVEFTVTPDNENPINAKDLPLIIKDVK